jgi:hypothetical protein
VFELYHTNATDPSTKHAPAWAEQLLHDHIWRFFSNKERFIKILVWRWRLRIFWYDWWLTISPLHFVFLAVYSSPERMSEESTRAAKQNKRTAQKKNKK